MPEPLTAREREILKVAVEYTNAFGASPTVSSSLPVILRMTEELSFSVAQQELYELAGEIDWNLT